MSLQSRYTILRKITDGGTAEIFLAKQHGAQGFEKMVVLKRIFTTFYADPQFRHLLVDEAHVAMSLNHSNIVQVLDLGEAEGRYFLALELVDGWTLDRILRRAKTAGVPFPPALALYVTAEVCRALGYAHGKARDGKSLGIVHRDISPHNVLLSAEGEVKLTDFGIAKHQNKKEPSIKNLIKGKISFMSPEQASGADIDARSDLFSLGTMLYAMITRRLPFDAPTDYETLMLVKSGDFLPPETARPGLNPELYRVIRKAMSKSAADRYQKADEMLVDVEQVMRLAFRPVGQTELQRWLFDLGAKDGVPPLTREHTPNSGPPSTVGPLAAAAGGLRPATRPTPAKAGRAVPPPLPASVGAPASTAPPRSPPVKDPGQESGVVLDLADAVEVASGSGRLPPPPPRSAPTIVSGPPTAVSNPPMVAVSGPPVAVSSPPTTIMGESEQRDWAAPAALAPWHQRRSVRLGGAIALLLLLGFSVKALVRGGRRGAAPPDPAPQASTPAPAAAPSAPIPTAPSAPAPAAAPSAPAPTAAAAAPPPAAPAQPTPAPGEAVAAAPAPAPAPAVVAPAPVAPKVAVADAAIATAPPSPPEEKKPIAVAERGGDSPPVPDPGEAREASAPATGEADPDAQKPQLPPLVSVMLESDPDGSQVSGRHRTYGTTPISLKLRPGKFYDLTFTKAGYALGYRRCTVTTKVGQSCHVTLKKLPEIKKAPPAPPAPPKKKDWWKFTR